MWDALGWVIFTLLFFGFFYGLADVYVFLRVVLPGRRREKTDQRLINRYGHYDYYAHAHGENAEEDVETERDRKTARSRLNGL